MKERKTQDFYEVNGRTFILKKFDPMIGNYILLQILTMTLPFGLSDKISEAVGSEIGKGSNCRNIDKKEFISLQRDILSFVFEKLPGNTPCVINDNGSYGINDFDMILCFQLIVAEIAFNFSDFFGEEGLTDIFMSH